MRRIVVLSALALFAAAASAATLEETFDQTYNVQPGAHFALANTNGRIVVHAWDQPRVRIHAEKQVKAAGDAARQAMAELKIEVTPSGGGLRVITRYPKRGDSGFFGWMFGQDVSASVTYDVTVPRAMSLDIEDTNGAVEVSDVRGSHKIGTTNGHITLAHDERIDRHSRSAIN